MGDVQRADYGQIPFEVADQAPLPVDTSGCEGETR
jgi:hypothetical protein